MKPQALAIRAAEDLRRDGAVPDRDLRATQLDERVLHRPGDQGREPQPAHLDPPLAGAAARAAGEDPGRARAVRPTARPRCESASGARSPGARSRRRPTSTRCSWCPSAADHAARPGGVHPDRDAGRCASARPTGAAYQQTQDDVVALLDDDPDKPDVAVHRDDFGFTWLVVDRGPTTTSRGSCTDLHAVNTALEEQGFGDRAAVLGGALRRRCRPAASGWSTSTSRAPSTPSPRPARRPATTSSRSRSATSSKAELPMEQDLQRWLALWGAPGL